MNPIHFIEWSESKIISFDFDDTLCVNGLPNKEIIQKLFSHYNAGDECIVVTARDRNHENDDWIKKHEPNRTKVLQFLKLHNLPITKVIFTNHKLKGPILKNHNVYLHFDDKDEELNSAKTHGILTIKVGNK